ncbi:hypothetical protein T07_9868 [Trichinella nelsoni]|uniref:Uncharacterized protein n=1 Tax=Trichinella nelsoni TaxID=6336 RepID=A0A0V0RCZ3_9BILA|nr:hypothetical protein T07_9868 [Trichinella nelsoni]
MNNRKHIYQFPISFRIIAATLDFKTSRNDTYFHEILYSHISTAYFKLRNAAKSLLFVGRDSLVSHHHLIIYTMQFPSRHTDTRPRHYVTSLYLIFD